MTKTWLSAQGDESKTVELAPSGFDVKPFPRQSRSHGGEIFDLCTNLFFSLTSNSKQTLILLTHRTK